MNYRYKNLLGYIGITNKTATLNSQFFSRLLANSPPLDKLLVFPQRLPKIGFFEELCALEQPNFTLRFCNTTDFLKTKIKSLISSLDYTEVSQRKLLNWLHIAIRFGLCNFLKNLSIPNLHNPANDYELRLLINNAHFESQLSAGLTPKPTGFLRLAKDALNRRDLPHRILIMIFTRLIVSISRHKLKMENIDILKKCTYRNLELLEETRHDDFLTCFLASFAYRGVAMSQFLSQQQKNTALIKAEKFARSLTPSEILQKIVSIENLYTLLQTMSKWHMSLGQLHQAESCLNEMLILDPHDSTGFAELGFFLRKQKKHQKASILFKKAADLGPPAVGMNLYFYGKCLKDMNKTKEAIAAMQQASVADPQAVSPLLDLITIYKNKSQIIKATSLARKILASPELYAQLYKDEKEMIQTLLDNLA